jgi:hypothetical protein
MVDIRKLGTLLDNLWRKLSRNVPPKVHVWRHLIEDINRLRGMKYHQESKLETAHQDGVKADLRFRAMAGSITKKIKASLKYQANMAAPAIRAKQEEINQERARKVGEKSKEAKQKRLIDAKRQKSNHRSAILALPEITANLPTMLELTVTDRMHARAHNDTLHEGS